MQSHTAEIATLPQNRGIGVRSRSITGRWSVWCLRHKAATVGRAGAGIRTGLRVWSVSAISQMAAATFSPSAITNSVSRPLCLPILGAAAVTRNLPLSTSCVARRLLFRRSIMRASRGSSHCTVMKIHKGRGSLWSAALLTRTGRYLGCVCTVSGDPASRSPPAAFDAVLQHLIKI